MDRRSVWMLVSLLLLVIAGTAGGVLWNTWSRPPPGHCPFCLRAEHAEARVVIEAEGERPRDACCMSCALSYQRQTGKRIRVLSVTDHRTHQVIDPVDAAFIIGSDESPCQHDMIRLGEEKSVDEVRWDRCLPSILAFGSRDQASAFQAEHGGAVRTLTELMDTPGTVPEHGK